MADSKDDITPEQDDPASLSELQLEGSVQRLHVLDYAHHRESSIVNRQLSGINFGEKTFGTLVNFSIKFKPPDKSKGHDVYRYLD